MTSSGLIAPIQAMAHQSDNYRILFARLYQLAGQILLDKESLSKRARKALIEVLLDCLADPDGVRSVIIVNFDGPVQDAAELAFKIKDNQGETDNE